MKNCQVTSFNKDADSAEEYILYTPTEKYPYTTWTDNAQSSYIKSGDTNCDDYVIQYSVKWRTYYDTILTIPVFITWKDSLPAFWVYSEDLIDVTTERQTYVVELTGEILQTDMDPIYSEVQKIAITVVNTCPTDTLSKISDTFSDYIYYIGENMEESVWTYSSSKPKVKTDFTANWSTSIPYCPMNFEIVRDFDDDGTYSTLTAHETAVVSLINPMGIGSPVTSFPASTDDTW